MTTELAGLTAIEQVGSPGDGRARYRATISPVFTIGPKVHGGSLQLVVAVAARQAAHDLAAPGTDLTGVTALAVSSDYLVAPDPAEVDVEVTMIKTGRTVSLARVDVRQHDRVMVTSTVTLGRQDSGGARFRGDTHVTDLPAEPPADQPDMSSTPMGEIVHLGAALDTVIDLESFPALRGETGAPVIRGWTRVKTPDQQPACVISDYPVLVCDISPPVVMNLGMFGWAPTVQLTTYLRRDPAPGWLRFAAYSSEVGQGMFAEDHVVVDSTGALVAQSRQLALIPARG